jgi:hypothetical protein
MTQWITDRLPTLEDADRNGDVQVPHLPRQNPSYAIAGRWTHFSLIVPGQPWWSPRVPIAISPLPTSKPAPEHADPMEQAQLERYRAVTKLIEARTTLVLAQAKAIAFPSYPPQSGAIQPPMMPGQPVPEGLFSH